MEPQEYDELLRHLVRIAAHQETMNEQLTASIEHLSTTMARLATLLARPPAAATRRARPKKRPLRRATAVDTTPAFDPTRHVLGKLCPRAHAYQGTGQSLLQRSNHKCLVCHREQARKRRQAKPA